MKDLLKEFLIAIVLVIGCVGGYYFVNENFTNRARKCDEDQGYLMRTFTEWAQKSIPDKYTVLITNIYDFYEIKTPPTTLGTTLYDDMKDGRICKATVDVKVTDKHNKVFNGNVDVRYQYSASIPNKEGTFHHSVRMSGSDITDMVQDIQKIILKKQ